VLAATLKGPTLAPGTRLINDLEDQAVYGVSGQQPPPIFRPERASPQVNQWLIRKRSPRSGLQKAATETGEDIDAKDPARRRGELPADPADARVDPNRFQSAARLNSANEMYRVIHSARLRRG
jgi:hypothetical protein